MNSDIPSYNRIISPSQDQPVTTPLYNPTYKIWVQTIIVTYHKKVQIIEERTSTLAYLWSMSL